MIQLSDIQGALSRIRADIRVSPCPRSETFSGLTGNSIYLKMDNQQRTGAFKERGALNKILTLNSDERGRGVVAASAGNHAQGVSYHAGRHGVRARIIMPLPTPLTKVSATRAYGADVLLHGTNYDEAYDKAVQLSQQDSLILIHAFDDEAVIAGQGTLGLEILQQHPEIEVIVSPIGGGGLIGGVACAVKESRPSVKVYGVQPARIPSMKAAVAAGKPVTVESAKTIADGIAVRRAGDFTLPLVQKYVDDVVTVEEEEIANAILLLLEREKTLAEGAGAAAIAAVLNRKLELHNKRVAVLVCGGNIDVTLLARIIERGLVKDGRLVRLRVHLGDYPGALYRLTGILADHRANIVETSYDRAYHGVNLGDTAIDITMETRGPEHIAELLAALGAGGYTHERIL
ncbi:MAG TPA: threonine ammonia-lyase [Candidatus Sulfotelmatobacter sp.]|nr:threonine ammonia-lyase [Candidatus Sulfotelmatobacter sp.]